MTTKLCALVACVLFAPGALLAQGTAFTYQGRLTIGTNVANGSFDLRFALFNTTNAGSQIGPLLTNSPVSVSNGFFTVALDFGAGVFPGAARWLEIAVRATTVPPNLPEPFTTLSPRQKLTPAPYAITAGSLSGTLPPAALAGTYTAAVTLNNAGNSFTGNGGGLTNVNALTLGGLSVANFWKITGNAGTTSTNFLGTTDNQALELKANSARALRLEPNASGAPNLIGGSQNNFVTPGVIGSVIAGGGATNLGGLRYTNSISADFGAIGGGAKNTIRTDASSSAIAGGVGNTIQSEAFSSTIAGGQNNTVQSTANGATIGGGENNTNSGPYATVPGGDQNVAGANSFAAGHRAKATNQGAFVWADSTDANFASTANNQFLIRASGGVAIGTNDPAGAALRVAGIIAADNFIAIAAAGTEPPSGVTPILNMVWIVPGTFVMGSPTSDPDSGPYERPQTVVTLTKGFWIGHHEVTQGEFLSLMNSNPSSFTGNLSLPVETVSWIDATNFCATLTQRERSAGRLPTGWVYRLPTEAQWEYACRALTTTRFYYGDDPSYSSLTNYAWYVANSPSTTHPVGQKLANPWGLVDMAGNVWEWVRDLNGLDAYPGGSVTDPTGPATGAYRVGRGGAWQFTPGSCRSASRLFETPTVKNAHYGFRAVLASGQP